ncbi:MAG: DMT family transporter [Pseudomonadota bacterium]
MQIASLATRHRHTLGLLLGVLGAVLFSAKAIVVKLAYRYGVDPETLLALRMFFALPFFLAIAYRQHQRAPISLTRRQGLTLLAMGVLGYYAASYLDFLGLQYISAALERLILFLYPTLVLLCAWLFFGRAVSPRQRWALLISYLGIAATFAHDVQLAQPHLWLGAGLVLASSVAYALYLLFGGELLQQIGVLRMTALASIIASLACIVQFLLMRELSVLQLPWQVYALSIFNALFCTVLPVFFVMFSVKLLGSGIAAQVGMIGPISTLFFSASLLDEALTQWHLLGTGAVLLGIFLLNHKPVQARLLESQNHNERTK